MLTRRSLIQLSAAMPAMAQSPAPAFHVRDSGARGDGTTNDGPAIQRTIDACAHAGGGIVCFPPGEFLSGSLQLRSHVTLHLMPGATLRGSRRVADYNPRHLIYAKGAERIAIEGGGTIDGQGDAFWGPDFKPVKERLGPMIELVDCRDVRIENVLLRNSPRWTVHPKNCDRVWIRGVSIINHLRGPNTDGIDPDSSRNVYISDCYVEGGDDCIVLKTTNVLPWVPQGYGEPVRPCEGVVVTNCTLVSSAAALKLGTESLADIRHCLFSNCVIRQTRTGIELFAKDGGTFENIRFSNITIETRPNAGRGVVWPITIDLDRRWKDSKIGRIRDVDFSGIRICTTGRILAGGMPESPLDGITFRDVCMRVSGFEDLARAGKLRDGVAQPVNPATDYGATPAAIIVNNARNIELHDVRLQWERSGLSQERHAIYCARVSGLRIDGFQGRQAVTDGKLAVIVLDEAKEVSITHSRAEAGTNVFLHLQNTASEEVALAANDLKKARKIIE